MTDREAAERIVDSLLNDGFEGRTKDARCRAVRPRLCDKGHPREEQWAHCDCLGRDLDARLGGKE